MYQCVSDSRLILQLCRGFPSIFRTSDGQRVKLLCIGFNHPLNTVSLWPTFCGNLIIRGWDQHEKVDQVNTHFWTDYCGELHIGDWPSAIKLSWWFFPVTQITIIAPSHLFKFLWRFNGMPLSYFHYIHLFTYPFVYFNTFKKEAWYVVLKGIST